MKKIMIAAMAVFAAVAANAAALKWGSGTVELAGGGTAGKNEVTGYLFLISSDTYNTLAANTTGKALSDAVYAAYGSSLASATASKATNAKGVANISDPSTYANGNTAYAALLFVEGDNYMGNVATYTLTSDLDTTIDNLALTIGGDVGGGSTATAWSTAAVPEPTSGLLMLLGMAGLVLRRRRA